MEEWIFATMAPPGDGAREALLLVKSVRRFAGSMAGSPFWVLVPQIGKDLDPSLEANFKNLHARLIPFSLPEDAHNFPFAAKVFAGAEAERLAEDASPILIWMDRGSLVLQEPGALHLPEDKILGYRPVDHTLIGSPYAGPIDEFWELVYERCGVSPENLFPMVTSVDEIEIRPYFNAGMLVVRLGRQLLRTWSGNFERHFRHPQFKPFYEEDVLYRIFIHQAFLAGTILATCAPNKLHLLPHLVNYPLHMHSDYPLDHRPRKMNDLISCRYETLFQDSAWADMMPIDEPLYSWLKEQHAGEANV